MNNTFLTIAIILVILWGLGFYIFPNTQLIHLLLAIAVIALIVNVVLKRKLI